MDKPFSFFLVTDPHYFENSLGCSGEAYEERSRTDQKCIAETGAIIDACFEQIANDVETNFVLIPGDLVYRSELESHKGFSKSSNILSQGVKQFILLQPVMTAMSRHSVL